MSTLCSTYYIIVGKRLEYVNDGLTILVDSLVDFEVHLGRDRDP